MLLLFYDVYDGNEPIILLDLLNIFHYIDVTDGNVMRSDVIDQLFDVLLFVLARCYAINLYWWVTGCHHTDVIGYVY